MSRSHCKPSLILGSGEDVPERPPLLGGNPLIVAADGGANLAYKWGLIPHIIIGDGDSISAETKEYWIGKQVAFLKYPTKKDHTDMELAINYAINQGSTSITLIGAWGSRVDHSLGNLELLYSLAQIGIKNRLLTKNQILSAFEGNFAIETTDRSIVSLVPLSSEVEGVTTQGLAYPLNNSNLIKGTTLSISNEAVERHIQIKTKKGVLLVILSNKKSP